jgi:hypothetical protein
VHDLLRLLGTANRHNPRLGDGRNWSINLLPAPPSILLALEDAVRTIAEEIPTAIF